MHWVAKFAIRRNSCRSELARESLKEFASKLVPTEVVGYSRCCRIPPGKIWTVATRKNHEQKRL